MEYYYYYSTPIMLENVGLNAETELANVVESFISFPTIDIHVLVFFTKEEF